MRKKYNRKDLVRLLAEKTGYHEFNISEIYTALEELLCEILLEADETHDIEIRLFYGLGLFSTFVPEHDKRMPDHSISHIEDSLKFEARFSNFWKKNKNTLYKDTRRIWKRVKERKRK